MTLGTRAPTNVASKRSEVTTCHSTCSDLCDGSVVHCEAVTKRTLPVVATNCGEFRVTFLRLTPSEKSPRPETARKAASRQRGVCQRLSGTICPQPREQHANDADALQCIASSQAQRSAACIPLRSRSVAADASCNAHHAARNAVRVATFRADVG